MPILNWLDRGIDIRITEDIPYRLLESVKKLSYGDPETENLIIQGDNLEALKALLPYYSGQVKCIYIDPPYNTQKAFEHYDDNLEHTKWLSMIYPRLELLRELLSEDGFFCCHIDDSQSHYLKVILDEIFGRKNFLSALYFQVRYADKTLKRDMNFHKQIEQVFVYRKSRRAIPNLSTRSASYDKFIFKIVEKNKGKKISLGGKDVFIFNKEDYKIVKEKEGHVDGLKEIWATGTILDGNSSGRFFRDYLTGRYKDDGLGVLYKVFGIGDDILDYRYFTGPKRETATKGKYFQGVPLNKREKLLDEKLPIENFYDLSGSFGNCRHEGGVAFRSGKKPEALLEKILTHFSNPNDLVLDSFLGSGGTCAVAHKMQRKYIGIEIGDHAETLVCKRLSNVIDGDTTGVSSQCNWNGGGGFKFFRLGKAVFDSEGQINEGIKFVHLASHIWFSETKSVIGKNSKKAFLGIHNDTAYYLLYNGILGDKRPQGGNVLTNQILKELHEHEGPKIIYGESTRLGPVRLRAENIVFKQTPYDVKAR